VVKKITNCDYNFDSGVWSSISEEAKQFISDCIQFDPSRRPKAEDALKADFLTKRPHHNFNVNTMKKVQESLVAYAQCNKLKQLALMVIAHKSSMDEVTKLRQVFSKYDSDKDGIISLTEFKAALADTNFTEEDINTVFQKLVRFRLLLVIIM
jgi:calcium-dependent protein kinase